MFRQLIDRFDVFYVVKRVPSMVPFALCFCSRNYILLSLNFVLYSIKCLKKGVLMLSVRNVQQLSYIICCFDGWSSP